MGTSILFIASGVHAQMPSQQMQAASQYDTIQSTDSLLNLLPETMGEKRIWLLNRLAHFYQDTRLKNRDLAKSIAYREQAIKLADDLGSAYASAKLRAKFAGFYVSINNYRLGAYYALEAQKRMRGVVPETEQIEFHHNVLSFMYYETGRYRDVIQVEEKVLKLMTGKTNQGLKGLVYLHLGNAYDHLQVHDSARYYFKQADEAFQALRDTTGLATIRVNLGELALEERNWPAAESLFTVGIKYAQQERNPSIESDALSNLVAISLHKHNIPHALQLAQRAMQTGVAGGVASDVMDAELALHDTYLTLDDYANAYKHYRRYKALADSARKDILTYQLQEADLQVRLNENEKQLTQLEQQTQSRIATTIVISLLVIGAVLIVVYQSRLKERHATNQKLEQSHAEVEAAITELKQAQQQLIITEKMAALGGLVNNIAHEINTPIGAILGSAHTLESTSFEIEQKYDAFICSLSPADFHFFQELRAAGNLQRINTLPPRQQRLVRKEMADQLKAIGRDDAEKLAGEITAAGLVYLDMLKPHLGKPRLHEMLHHAGLFYSMHVGIYNSVVAAEQTRKVVSSLRLIQGEHTTKRSSFYVKETLEAALKPYRENGNLGLRLTEVIEHDLQLYGDPVEIHTVWMNLLQNAVQAIESKGHIHVETAMRGDYFEVSITDDGHGIKPAHTPRVFEPFFTTKSDGQGAGLGLYVSKRIVERHGGSIGVTAEPGRTRFWVRFPQDNPTTNENA